MNVFAFIKYQDSIFSKNSAIEFLPAKNQNSNDVSDDMRVIDTMKTRFPVPIALFSLGNRLGE